jgi:iron complex transport system permease protein
MTRAGFIGGLLALALLSMLAGLLIGSVRLAPQDVIAALTGDARGVDHDIVWLLRLPRVLSAFACGGLLALSGVLLQVLLRNPLADPYILGISGGSAVAALCAMLFGLAGHAVSMAALGGAVVAAAAVFGLSFQRRMWSMDRLLLTGVVLAAGFGAIISLILILAPQTSVRGMLFWLMGDLAHAGTPSVPWSVLFFIGMLAVYLSPSINILSLGEACSRGIDTTD